MKWYSVLIVMGMICGCQPPELTLDVRAVDATQQAVRCGEPFHATSTHTLALEKLRFYLHDIQVRDESGRWHEVQPVQGTSVGQHGVWLVDLDDQACDPKYSPETSQRLTFKVPTARPPFKGLRVRLGVPFDLNHKDPLKAEPHLAQTSMHWGWQAGYRFFRMDTHLVEDKDKSFDVHLGSTGCEGEIGDISGCSRPNRPAFEFSGDLFPGDSRAEVLDLNLSTLLHGVDWSSPEGCMGGPDGNDCRAILKNLNVDVDTGEQLTAEHKQRVFSVGKTH